MHCGKREAKKMIKQTLDISKPYAHIHYTSYCIDIDFSSLLEEMLILNYMKEFNQHYGPYLVKNCKKKADFKLKLRGVRKVSLMRAQSERKKSEVDYSVQIFSIKGSTALVDYHASISHLQLLFKLIIQKLLIPEQGFFLHTSGVLTHDNRLILFLGQNNAGKSTTISLIRDYYKPFADDTVLIKKVEKSWLGYQIPVEADREIYPFTSTKGYPIEALVFIHKNKLTKCSSLPKDPNTLAQFLNQVVGGTVHKNNIQAVLKYFESVNKIFKLDINTTMSGKELSNILDNN